MRHGDEVHLLTMDILGVQKAGNLLFGSDGQPAYDGRSMKVGLARQILYVMSGLQAKVMQASIAVLFTLGMLLVGADEPGCICC